MLWFKMIRMGWVVMVVAGVGTGIGGAVRGEQGQVNEGRVGVMGERLRS